MDWRNLIEQNPGVMLGKPAPKGIRLTVEHVLTELGRGMSEAELLPGHARLTADHIRAALPYAAAAVGSDEIACR